MKLPLSSIAVLNRQRRELDPKKLQQLADSIKERGGLIHDITVRRPFEHELSEISEEASYVLCTGGRRLAAHILLGWDSIEAKLKENLSPLEAAIIELEENLVRSDITWQEEVDAKAKIHSLRLAVNPFHTLAETAGEIGEDTANLSKDLKLHRMIQADPSLKLAGSKAGAIRAFEHKTEMAARVRKLETADRDYITKRLSTDDGVAFIKRVPSQSIDLVFSDLPYGIDYFENAAGSEGMKGQYDDEAEACKAFIAAIVPEALRVVKPGGWIVFFMCYEWHGWLQDQIRDTCLTHRDPRAILKGKKMDYCEAAANENGVFSALENQCAFLAPEMPPWIWTRRGSGNNGHWPELHASNRYEMIVAVRGPSAKLVKKPVENVLDFPPFSGERLHAMQKPHELCQEIIQRTTVVGEVVLDICFGSGAHLAAAASLGRDFLGCDNNPGNLPTAIQLVASHFHRVGGAGAGALPPKPTERPSTGPSEVQGG